MGLSFYNGWFFGGSIFDWACLYPFIILSKIFGWLTAFFIFSNILSNLNIAKLILLITSNVKNHLKHSDLIIKFKINNIIF